METEVGDVLLINDVLHIVLKVNAKSATVSKLTEKDMPVISIITANKVKNVAALFDGALARGSILLEEGGSLIDKAARKILLEAHKSIRTHFKDSLKIRTLLKTNKTN
jgi:hypothetical protein